MKPVKQHPLLRTLALTALALLGAGCVSETKGARETASARIEYSPKLKAKRPG